MDKKEARKILGVNKETSRNDIERKYSILLKKHRAASLPPDRPGEDTAEEGAPEAGTLRAASAIPPKEPVTGEYSFDQITEAYNVLMGYEVAVKEEPPSKVAPLLKKAGIDEKKARNFFYYYKFYKISEQGDRYFILRHPQLRQQGRTRLQHSLPGHFQLP
jgi:hypothetical protein